MKSKIESLESKSRDTLKLKPNSSTPLNLIPKSLSIQKETKIVKVPKESQTELERFFYESLDLIKKDIQKRKELV